MIDLREAVKAVNKKSSFIESLNKNKSDQPLKEIEESTKQDELKVVKYYFKDNITDLGKLYYEEEKLTDEEYSNESLKIIKRFEDEILQSSLDDWDFTEYRKYGDNIEPLQSLKNSGKETMIDAKGGIVDLDFVKFNNGHFGVINHSNNIVYELLKETQYEESLGRAFKDMKITSKKRIKESMDIEEFATRLSNVLYDYDYYGFADSSDNSDEFVERSLEWYKENPKSFKKKAKEDLESIAIEDSDLEDEHYKKIKKEKELLLKEVDNLNEEKKSTKVIEDEDLINKLVDRDLCKTKKEAAKKVSELSNEEKLKLASSLAQQTLNSYLLDDVNKKSKKNLKESYDMDIVHNHFPFATSSMLDLVTSLVDSFEHELFAHNLPLDEEDALDMILGDDLTYEWQYWEIMQHYQRAIDANFEKAYYDFYDDMLSLVEDIFGDSFKNSEEEIEEQLDQDSVTKESLWKARQEIVLGSIYTRDYSVSVLDIDDKTSYNFFSGYEEYLDELSKEDGKEIDELDNPDTLWDWYNIAGESLF